MGTCGNPEQLLRSVDVLPGRASATQAIHVMALAGLKAHHRNNSGRVHSTAEARVPPVTCRGAAHFSERVF